MIFLWYFLKYTDDNPVPRPMGNKEAEHKPAINCDNVSSVISVEKPAQAYVSRLHFPSCTTVTGLMSRYTWSLLEHVGSTS